MATPDNAIHSPPPCSRAERLTAVDTLVSCEVFISFLYRNCVWIILCKGQKRKTIYKGLGRPDDGKPCVVQYHKELVYHLDVRVLVAESHVSIWVRSPEAFNGVVGMAFKRHPCISCLIHPLVGHYEFCRWRVVLWVPSRQRKRFLCQWSWTTNVPFYSPLDFLFSVSTMYGLRYLFSLCTKRRAFVAYSSAGGGGGGGAKSRW